MDRDKLREKIYRILWNYVGSKLTNAMVDASTAEIEALIPDIERVSIQITEDLLAHQKEKIEEAKKQERERILNQMEPERCDPDVMPYFEDYYWLPESVWQALKETEGGS